MAYPTRSVRELTDRAVAAFRRELPGSDATLNEAFLNVDAVVSALLLKEMDLRAEWLYDQLFASTATAEHLEQRHAYEFGVVRKPASPASGSITAAGPAGFTYPAGLKWLAGGVVYASTASVTVATGGALTVPVVATTTGATTNRVVGEELALSDPGQYPGLATTAVVSTDGISGGADIESIESLRARVLARKRKPPQGGSEADYERFTLDLPFVTKAWARRLVNGPGSVGIWFLSTGGGIPTSSEVAAVKSSIEKRRLIGLRDLRVYAPVAVAVPVTIDLVPDTVQTRANVTAGLQAMFVARSRPGLPDDPFVLSRSWIAEAVSDAIGEQEHDLVFPTANMTFGLGQYPVLGSVTFI